MREADDDAICRSTIFVDTAEALHEAGDLTQPLHDGLLAEAEIAGTLRDLCRGEARGRRSEDEITLYKAVGTALADLTAATLAYEALTGRGDR